MSNNPLWYPDHLPGAGRRPSSTDQQQRSNAAPPRFQSLARIANQGIAGAGAGSGSGRNSGGSEERSQEQQQHARSMERRRGQQLRSAPVPWKHDRRWSEEILRRYEDNLGCEEHEVHAPFFTPSYLRGNRFVERLRRGWEAHIAELEERKSGDVTGQTQGQGQSRSRKASGSFRGAFPLAQDVVEHQQRQHNNSSSGAGLLSGAHSPSDENREPSTGLPSRWSDYDKWPGLEVVGDGSEVRFSGVCKTTDEAASIRTDYPIPVECGLYYYEVTILSKCKEGLIGVGFSGSKTALSRLPGWESESWAYHGDDGYSFAQCPNGKAYGPKFQSSDVIGCGVNFRTGSVFFTRNGIHLGTAFTNLKISDALYPSIGIKKSGEHIRANFGRDKFVFDIDGMMSEERRVVRAQLNRADVSALHPPDDETSLVQNLVAQYLAHEGYVETSKAFARDVRERAAAGCKEGDSDAAASLAAAEDDVQTLNRQKIRRAILDGDIDRALKYTQTFYPRVLEDERNRDVYFQLKCRKFVEMMRRYSEGQGGGGERNGHADAPEDVNDAMGDNGQMEVDEGYTKHRQHTQAQQQTEDDTEMDLSTSTSSLRPPSTHTNTNTNKTPTPSQNATHNLTTALHYGQELQAEFGSDPSSPPHFKEQLRELFAIMAYVDPRESVVGGLLDTQGRAGIAEGVNGAILVSLGKPSSAALERVCAQTEVFLDAVAARGGGEGGSGGGGQAGFVNVREDFLKG